MIRLHRLNGQEVVVNAELVELIESHGQETVIQLATGNRLVVTEPVTEVLALSIAYRQTVCADQGHAPSFLRMSKEVQRSDRAPSRSQGGTSCR